MDFNEIHELVMYLHFLRRTAMRHSGLAVRVGSGDMAGQSMPAKIPQRSIAFHLFKTLAARLSTIPAFALEVAADREVGGVALPEILNPLENIEESFRFPRPVTALRCCFDGSAAPSSEN